MAHAVNAGSHKKRHNDQRMLGSEIFDPFGRVNPGFINLPNTASYAYIVAFGRT